MMNFASVRTAGIPLRLKRLATALGKTHSANILKVVAFALMLALAVIAPGSVGPSFAQNPLSVFADSWDGVHSF